MLGIAHREDRFGDDMSWCKRQIHLREYLAELWDTDKRQLTLLVSGSLLEFGWVLLLKEVSASEWVCELESWWAYELVYLLESLPEEEWEFVLESELDLWGYNVSRLESAVCSVPLFR